MGAAIDDLVATVHALWPQASEARLTTSASAAARGSDGWIVVPNARSPRLLVPSGSRRAGARSLLRFSSALTVPEILTRSFGALAVAARLRPLVPDVLVLAAPEGDSIQSHITEALGSPVQVSLGIGSVRANRKPVLEVFDEAGRSIAFAKVGYGAVAARAVLAEHEALQRLAGVPLNHVRVPSVRHFGYWRDLPVLLMSALPTSALQRPGGRWRLPLSAMAALEVGFSTGVAPLHGMSVWAQLREVADNLADERLRERVLGALMRLDVAAGDTPFLVTAWHGDWTPWNMARAGKHVFLWDWERFATGVPPGLDRVHYAVNTTTRARGATVEKVLAGVAWAGEATVGNPDTSFLTAAVYLAAIAGRYLASAQEPGGEAIQVRAGRMLDSLERHLAEGGAGR